MNELILNTLTPLCLNTNYGWFDKDINDTQITFLEFMEKEDNYSDDEATIIDHYYQVSIFSKGNIEEMKIDVKTALKEVGFLYQDGADLIESLEDGSKLYHKATRWLYQQII